MARILVIYATQYGQAGKIAQVFGDTLRQAGIDADVVEASDGAPGPELYDGVIVVGSVHAGGYQRPLRRWVRTHAETLVHKTAAFVSVCLGVLQHDPAVDRHLVSIREQFERQTGWHPGVAKVVAGSLPYTRYNWITRLMMRRIVAKAGGDTDTRRDYEYTDWEHVRSFARDFASHWVASRFGEARPRVSPASPGVRAPVLANERRPFTPDSEGMASGVSRRAVVAAATGWPVHRPDGVHLPRRQPASVTEVATSEIPQR
jgi:menaquinone-dependent protoporphyrinogen oxidase